jgi:hypothetical protein
VWFLHNKKLFVSLVNQCLFNEMEGKYDISAFNQHSLGSDGFAREPYEFDLAIPLCAVLSYDKVKSSRPNCKFHMGASLITY